LLLDVKIYLEVKIMSVGKAPNPGGRLIIASVKCASCKRGTIVQDGSPINSLDINISDVLDISDFDDWVSDYETSPVSDPIKFIEAKSKQSVIL
jgi:hypothetical protein